MDISSISSSTISADQSVDKISANKTETESTQTSKSLVLSGDTVQISDEALSSLQSAQAASSDTGTTSSETEGSDGTGGTAAAGASTGSAASGSSSSTSSSNSDEIAKLEKEIRALQQEIAALAAKALTDENAKSELSAKQTELGGLTAQLTQLQLQQA